LNKSFIFDPDVAIILDFFLKNDLKLVKKNKNLFASILKVKNKIKVIKDFFFFKNPKMQINSTRKDEKYLRKYFNTWLIKI